jgi:hypothetical protein
MRDGLMGVGVVGAMMIFYLIWLVHGGFWGGHPPSRYRGTDSRHSFFCPAPVVVVVVVVVVFVVVVVVVVVVVTTIV